MSEIDPRFRASCEDCAGLCCVSLAFDRSEWFAFDKPADEPCRYLLHTDRCAVHSLRQARGLSGCARYDCYGAGQRVTQELLAGRSWRTSPELAPRIFAAFRAMRDLQELLLLLHTAERLRLTLPQARERARLIAELTPDHGFELDQLATLDTEPLRAKVSGFLRRLRPAAHGAGSIRRLPLVSAAQRTS